MSRFDRVLEGFEGDSFSIKMYMHYDYLDDKRHEGYDLRSKEFAKMMEEDLRKVEKFVSKKELDEIREICKLNIKTKSKSKNKVMDSYGKSLKKKASEINSKSLNNFLNDVEASSLKRKDLGHYIKEYMMGNYWDDKISDNPDVDCLSDGFIKSVLKDVESIDKKYFEMGWLNDNDLWWINHHINFEIKKESTFRRIKHSSEECSRRLDEMYKKLTGKEYVETESEDEEEQL